ncbi:methyltransferase domain-containing protein [Synechococcus elongatus IITB7]|uniref:class I SAM-dependent methyltransferase n=1 Tax=Synechococcus elongatus TaxID=32046 RepID=UPI0030D2C02E
MADPITKFAYQTFQQSKSLLGLTHKNLSTQLMRLIAPTEGEREGLSPELMSQLQASMQVLLDEDYADAEAGVYPLAQLFDTPWQDIVQQYPRLWLDMPSTWQRAREKRYQDFEPTVETDRYPSYYVQNFHHQTGGYLTEDSAELYDLQVEILFNGTADPMRRRILRPLKQGLQALARPEKDLRVLDVACGTGRTLRHLRSALPSANLYGTDLSPAYLRKANQLLSERPGELPQLLQANAEELPYQDGFFQGVTSVFLFHELPPQARQNVINECFRVLESGGTVVLNDSIQAIDSPQFRPLMDGFYQMFHEPYYRHYMEDDLCDRLSQAGFVDIQTSNHFMSKIWVARKPIA